MDKKFEKKYHDLEASHFWFKARRSFLLQLLNDTKKDVSILDIGCSSGLLLKNLKAEGFNSKRLFGIDISSKAIDNCKKNGLDNCFVMSGEDLKLNQKFDIIIASDCLEHINNDQKALNDWFDHLKPEGKLYIFVPAFKSLWSHHDEANMHFRRYTKNQLVELLDACNFRIKRSSYWNFTLFIPLLLFRKMSNIFQKTISNRKEDNLHQLNWLNQPLFWLLALENKILKNLNFPFGISVFAVAEKEYL